MIKRTPFFCFQITVSFDETTTLEDVDDLFKVFALGKPVSIITPLSMLLVATQRIHSVFLSLMLLIGPVHCSINCTRG